MNINQRAAFAKAADKKTKRKGTKNPKPAKKKMAPAPKGKNKFRY
jgi:hypothetical protein